MNKDKIIYHKNKKVDVLATYNNLSDSERVELWGLLKTKLCICPVNALCLAKPIRDLLGGENDK